MGFIKAGFTGGFLGIVISIADIFVNSPYLEKLSSIGLYIAEMFGKACINTPVNECTLAEKFTTVLATIVGNCIAYFVIFALISLAIAILKMWISPKKAESSQQVQQPPQQVQQPQVVQVQVQPQIQQTETKEERPKKKAKVRKKK